MKGVKSPELPTIENKSGCAPFLKTIISVFVTAPGLGCIRKVGLKGASPESITHGLRFQSYSRQGLQFTNHCLHGCLRIVTEHRNKIAHSMHAERPHSDERRDFLQTVHNGPLLLLGFENGNFRNSATRIATPRRFFPLGSRGRGGPMRSARPPMHLLRHNVTDSTDQISVITYQLLALQLGHPVFQ